MALLHLTDYAGAVSFNWAVYLSQDDRSGIAPKPTRDHTIHVHGLVHDSLVSLLLAVKRLLCAVDLELSLVADVVAHSSTPTAQIPHVSQLPHAQPPVHPPHISTSTPVPHAGGHKLLCLPFTPNHAPLSNPLPPLPPAAARHRAAPCARRGAAELAARGRCGTHAWLSIRDAGGWGRTSDVIGLGRAPWA